MSDRQSPLDSPFTAASTAAEVLAGLDLTGRTAIVTGGYSGLGIETTRALSAAGATVIVPARDLPRARAATAGLERVEVAAMELTDPRSVLRFAEDFVARGVALPILIASAGVMATPLFRDADGHEGQFATNHLGHFRLVRALWPALARARGARVVSVSSRGHQIAGVDFDDIDFARRPYDRWTAYGRSKTANALFAVELDKRGAEDGVRAFSLHPGQILTELARHLTPEDLAGFDATDETGARRVDPERGMKTPEQGAATSVWAATSPLLDSLGGVYLEDCDVARIYRGGEDRKGVAPYAVDEGAAARLWAATERM